MASALMAWVCIAVTLAQLNNAGGHRHARGLLTDQDELDDGIKQQLDAAPEASMELGFPAPVWNFLQGGEIGFETSDFKQPQYRCNNGTLFLRFSLIRYSNLHLEGGAQLLSLTDLCNSTVKIYKWWMLVKLSYTGCRMALQTKHGSGAHVLKVHYYDRLREENTTGMAVCKNPEMSQVVPPLVTCGTKRVTVKLPRETKLKKVKDLDFSNDEGYSVKQQRTTCALFVEISKLPSKDSGFEVVYVDSTGTLCTMLAACTSVLPEKVERQRVGRSLQEPDVFELWGFDDIPSEPFNPSQTVTPATTPSQTVTPATTSSGTDTDAVTDSVTGVDTFTNDGDIDELWGFETIPDGPFTGLPNTGLTTTTATTAGPVTATTTAKMTTATTAGPVTTATTTAKTTTATTAGPVTTATTTAKTTTATTAAKTTKATTKATTTAKTTKATTKATTTAKTTKATTTAKTTKATTTAKTTKATTAKTTKATTKATTTAKTTKATTKATTTAKTTKATTKATTTAKTTKATTTAKTTKATTTAKTTKATTTAKTTKATTTAKTTKATTTAKTTKATTAPPPTTTAPPPTTTAPPPTTTAPPQTTTAPPATTSAPPVTTAAPLATTSAAPVTTAAPLATT